MWRRLKLQEKFVCVLRLVRNLLNIAKGLLGPAQHSLQGLPSICLLACSFLPLQSISDGLDLPDRYQLLVMLSTSHFSYHFTYTHYMEHSLPFLDSLKKNTVCPSKGWSGIIFLKEVSPDPPPFRLIAPRSAFLLGCLYSVHQVILGLLSVFFRLSP